MQNKISAYRKKQNEIKAMTITSIRVLVVFGEAMMGGCRGFYDGGNILNLDLDSNYILQNVPFLINQISKTF
jgi:hypothetical protein